MVAALHIPPDGGGEVQTVLGTTQIAWIGQVDHLEWNIAGPFSGSARSPISILSIFIIDNSELFSIFIVVVGIVLL